MVSKSTKIRNRYTPRYFAYTAVGVAGLATTYSAT